jgi:probable HAF family extracellular repeat protein
MKILSLLVLLCASTCPLVASGGIEYSITDLGTLGGDSSHAFALNNLGEVVGSSITASGAEHAFLYQNGVMTDLGVLNPGDTFSRAYGINASGVIVGQSLGATSSPFVYSGGSMSLGLPCCFARQSPTSGRVPPDRRPAVRAGRPEGRARLRVAPGNVPVWGHACQLGSAA